MSRHVQIPSKASKAQVYEAIFPQIEALLQDEKDFIANVANTVAVLKEALKYYWIGIYLVKGNELVLGPFQGTVACTRIARGRGVCGQAWERGETIIVPDVDRFPGHIACSIHTRSEIVVPVRCQGRIIGVLDLDSTEWNDFDTVDLQWLERIADLLGRCFETSTDQPG